MLMIKEFEIHVPDEELADLQSRLARTRFIDPLPEASAKAGLPVEYLRRLLTHWRDQFSWRELERRINGFTNVVVSVDGAEVHCAIKRGSGDHRVPIVLLHGWPSSFVEYLDLADHLASPTEHGASAADSFDVVIPSVPGYGYSPYPGRLPYGDLLARALEALGYPRFAIHTHDIGAGMMADVLVTQPERVIGYHTTEAGIPGPTPRPSAEELSDEEKEWAAYRDAWHADQDGYVSILGTRPVTMAHALNDSPAGLAAWIGEKWWDWTIPPGSDHGLDDYLSYDQVLANIALYWHTRTISTVNWLFHPVPSDNAGTKWWESEQPVTAHVPVGVARTNQPIERHPRAWVERFFPDIRRFEDLGRGGNFVAIEEPALLAHAIREFIRPLRTEIPG